MSARDVIADAAVWCSAHDDVGRYRDADMILARLSAAGFVVEQGWQPIETAPREMGSEVLLFIAPFAAMQGVRRSDGTWMVGARSIIGRLAPYEPTHWRPLPAPPAEEADHD